MNLRYARINLLVVLLLMGFSLDGIVPNLSAKREAVTLTGHLSIVWRDEVSGSTVKSEPIFILSDETGHSTRLLIPDALARSTSPPAITP